MNVVVVVVVVVVVPDFADVVGVSTSVQLKLDFPRVRPPNPYKMTHESLFRHRPGVGSGRQRDDRDGSVFVGRRGSDARRQSLRRRTREEEDGGGRG